MGLDASALIGAPEIAAANVNPSGFGKRAGLREAGLAGEALAAVSSGRPPAGTPEFRRIARLVVTNEEVALVAIERGRLSGVLARVPRNTVVSAEVGGGLLNTPVTIAFQDGGAWRFEVSRLIRRQAQAVVDVLNR